MEIKRNDSTINRPDGERLLDAPLVRMNLREYTQMLKNEPGWVKNDRNSITLLHNHHLRIVLMALHGGAELPENSLDGSVCIQVLEGRIWLTTEEESLSLDAGESAALREHVQHSIHAEEETVLLLTCATNEQGEA